jgi:hypothetical protein
MGDGVEELLKEIVVDASAEEEQRHTLGALRAGCRAGLTLR